MVPLLGPSSARPGPAHRSDTPPGRVTVRGVGRSRTSPPGVVPRVASSARYVPRVDLTLLGTGAAEGWPNPFCACASCARMRRRGDVRAPTGALLDATVLVDAGPEALGAAARLGLDLSGVRHLLLSHAPPGWDGGVPRWRSWAGRGAPLDVVAPPSVVATCGESPASDDAVTLSGSFSGTVRAVRPGDTVDVAGYRVRALA